MNIDGTYAVHAAGTAGVSNGIVTIDNGRLIGNDTSGSRYNGTVQEQSDGKIHLDLEMNMPPNTFGIWGTSDTETVQTRRIEFDANADAFTNAAPQALHGYGMNVIFTRIPDEHASLAGASGIKEMIQILQNAQSTWDRQ